MHPHFLRATAACVLLGSTAFAQNLRFIPVGGKTATMGGAAMAMGDDSAMPLLNPAGIANNGGNDLLSVSASLYGYFTQSVPTYWRPRGFDPNVEPIKVDEESFSTNQFLAIPTGLTYFRNFSDEKAKVRHFLAASIHTPAYQDFNAGGTFRADGQNYRLQADSITSDKLRQMYFGPSYALAIEDRFRFGVSVFGYYSDFSVDDHLVSFVGGKGMGFEDPNAYNERVQVGASCWGIAATMGAQLRIWRELWAGLALESPGLPFGGSGTLSSLADESAVDFDTGMTTARHSSSQGKFTHFAMSRPMRISGGLAYHQPSSFTIAADVYVHIPVLPFEEGDIENNVLRVTSNMMPTQETIMGGYKRSSKATVNISAGGEIELTKKYQIRLGFLTDFDAIEGTSNGQANNYIDWYGATAGFGMAGDPFGATYGFSYRYGRGRVYAADPYGPGLDPNTTVPIDVDAHAFFVILAGTIEVGAAADVMARLDPKQRVRNMLRAAR